MIEVRVNGIFLTQSQASGIILKEKEGNRTLPIVIGEYEAQSIALALEDLKPPRPITHDLTVNLLDSIGVSIESVIISELKENTYYAIIRIQKDMETMEIDARPSDAIALAVRLGTNIFVNETVMDQAAYIPDDKETDDKNYLFKSATDNLGELKEQLKKAVDSEEYEKAAKIRDQIKKLESGS
ncbi:MAG: bifunctional nuclease family protein [Calditrichaceae bacterium]